jgi:hypothetical protein
MADCVIYEIWRTSKPLTIETTMARKSSRAASKNAESESPDAGEGKITKTAAVKAALAEGIESPEEGVDFIQKRFGIEIGRQHFSAVKS